MSEGNPMGASQCLPARLLKMLFAAHRPRGSMRLGCVAAALFPCMRRVPVMIDGSPLFVDLRSMDHQIVYLEGRYPWEVPERAFLKHVVRPGDVAVDVGANLGVFSVRLAGLTGGDGLVLAYEPAPELLYVNTGTLPQVIVRPFVLSDRDGTVGFTTVRQANTYSHVATDGTQTSMVRSVSLDHELDRLGMTSVDFMKVDVEGHEEFVFRGASRTLATPGGPLLMFEWNPAFRSRWKMGAISVLREIVGDSWQVYRMTEDGRLASLGGWHEPTTMGTIIACPPERADRLPAGVVEGA